MALLRCSHARRAALIGVALAIVSIAGPASAQPTGLQPRGRAANLGAQDPKTIEQARDAFDQGAAAYTRKEFAQAADYFARADELVPSEEALEAALDSATRADDPALAMRLADRAGRSASPGKGLADAARAAQERFRKRAGRIVVRCSSECSPTLDGQPVAVGVPTWTLTGNHSVVAVHHGVQSSSSVDVSSDRLAEVLLTLPAETRAGSGTGDGVRTTSTGISPAWFWVGVGATTLLGGAALFSGLDTMEQSDDFKKAGCEAQGSDACDRLGDSGRSAQLRTNLFVGGAAVTAVASVVLAAFFVDWRSRTPKSTALPFTVGPGSVAFTGTLP